jgi:hypothetical protein
MKREGQNLFFENLAEKQIYSFQTIFKRGMTWPVLYNQIGSK